MKIYILVFFLVLKSPKSIWKSDFKCFEFNCQLQTHNPLLSPPFCRKLITQNASNSLRFTQGIISPFTSNLLETSIASLFCRESDRRENFQNSNYFCKISSQFLRSSSCLELSSEIHFPCNYCLGIMYERLSANSKEICRKFICSTKEHYRSKLLFNVFLTPNRDIYGILVERNYRLSHKINNPNVVWLKQTQFS